jgi:hypothetical protein
MHIPNDKAPPQKKNRAKVEAMEDIEIYKRFPSSFKEGEE